MQKTKTTKAPRKAATVTSKKKAPAKVAAQAIQPKGVIRHHAKRIIKLTPMFVHGMVAGMFIGIIAVMTLRAAVPANALSLTTKRDCDTNAVINCGAVNTTELQQRYSNKGVSAIYNHFGISAADINIINSTAVAGVVYKDGKVTVSGVTVATGATTAGRENITGSTKVSSGGVTFYKRAPSVSFRVDSIPAFVVMENGQFKFAILGACGNPVSATPVPKATPPPPIQTVAPPPVTTPEVPTTPTPSTQTPESTPTVITAAATTTLPNTGPGAVIIVAIAAVAGGYIFHITHRHIKRRRHTTRHHDISRYVTH